MLVTTKFDLHPELPNRKLNGLFAYTDCIYHKNGYIKSGKSFIFKLTNGKSVTWNHNKFFDCDSKDVLYILICNNFDYFYLAKTIDFKQRISKDYDGVCYSFDFFYFPWFWSSSRGNRGWGGQSWTKKANFGCPVSVKIENFERLFKRCLFLLNYYPWWRFQQNWTVFEGVTTQKLPKKDHFMDADTVRKALKIFNLTNYECYIDKTYQNYLYKTFGA